MVDTCVLLLSGGLDSAVCLYQLLDSGVDVYPLFVHYGQAAEQQEYQAVLRLIVHARECFNLETLNLQHLSTQMMGSFLVLDQPTWYDLDDPKLCDGEYVQVSPTYVPARNTLLALMGFQLAYKYDLDAVALGVKVLNDHLYPDCGAEWAIAMQHLFSIHTLGERKDVRLLTPVGAAKRSEVRIMAKEYGVPEDILMSCLLPLDDGSPCGECSSCLEEASEVEYFKKKH